MEVRGGGIFCTFEEEIIRPHNLCIPKCRYFIVFKFILKFVLPTIFFCFKNFLFFRRMKVATPGFLHDRFPFHQEIIIQNKFNRTSILCLPFFQSTFWTSLLRINHTPELNNNFGTDQSLFNLPTSVCSYVCPVITYFHTDTASECFDSNLKTGN
jgi:hypothetical protein